MRKMVVSFSRRAALLCLALAVSNLHSAIVLANDAKKELPPAGELTISGGVDVDGAPAVSGQTFFSGSTLRVASGSLSTLRLRHLSRVELSEETTLKLDFSDEQLTGALTAGRLRVFAPAGVNARFVTSEASVMADARQPATFSIESGRDVTTVSVEAGQVEMMVGNRRHLVSAGQTLSSLIGSPALPHQPQPFSGAKRNVFLLGLAGVLAMIPLILAGDPTQERTIDDCFGGNVSTVSPTSIVVGPCG